MSRPARSARASATRALSIVAALVVSGLVGAAAIAPQGAATASSRGTLSASAIPTQQLDLIVAAQFTSEGSAGVRDSFSGEARAAVMLAPASAPHAAVPNDPATAQGIGYAMLQARGWDDSQWSCLVALWNRESHWNVYAYNSSSGAYGIPQALPGSKMASAGADWATSFATQVNWGLGYVEGRYGTPCGAWDHSESTGWY